ncbi:MAG: 3'-5' exonuclease [Thioploca sp.]|nr:3'-5' exonuclease [Thioploca sp.]
MNVFVFDMETVPDVEAGRRLYGNHSQMANLSDEEVIHVMYHYHGYPDNGQDHPRLRPHLQKIVAIAAVLRSGERLRMDSLGTLTATETEIIQQFFKSIQHYTPTLVSWDGYRSDLPVLHYRALLHGINAQRYWDIHQEFRFNNYTHRYHDRHTDLMDVIAGYQPNAGVNLEEMSRFLELPSQSNLSSNQIEALYLQGRLEDIRAYCEINALNTYLIFLRFELMRGHLGPVAYELECHRLQELLTGENKPHLQSFSATWLAKAG